MNGWALLGILLLLYAGFVLVVGIKKPMGLWEMKKIQLFRKILGEKGTQILFFVFAAIACGFGIWLLIQNR